MVAGGFNARKKGADCMNWILITAENQKHIRVGDFVTTQYCRGVLYKVLSTEYYECELYLAVGVCDKHGNIDEECIYHHPRIICFDSYSPQNRKVQVV